MILNELGIVFKDAAEVDLVFGDHLHLNKSVAHSNASSALEDVAATGCSPKVIFPSIEAQNLDRFKIVLPLPEKSSILYTFDNFNQAFEYMYSERDNPSIINYQEKRNSMKFFNINVLLEVVEALKENANITEDDILHIDITPKQVIITLKMTPSVDIAQAIKHEISLLPNKYKCWILDMAIIVDAK